MTSIELSEAEKETELKKEKSTSKSSFTLYRNRLVLLIEEHGVPRTEVNRACRKMDSYMKSSMEVMSELSDIYIRNKQLDKATKIVTEMEKLEEEFHSAYETVWEFLNLLKNDKSPSAKSVGPRQRKCSMEESKSVSLRREKMSTEQTMSYGNIRLHESGSCGNHDIGEDLWRQLKRIELPVFNGDKRSYRNWKAVFMACVDTAPATGEYKLLELRQCLSGEALNVIENLGHSATAYEAAKERLERRYGGKRRQVAIYLEDLDRFQQIRPGNVQDLEQFSDMLETAVLNLKETGHHNELGNGFLYGKLRTKLTESMLAKYHRWVYETQTPESVVALKTWVFQESAYQTIASETVNGIIGNVCNQSSPDSPALISQRAFFGEIIDRSSMKNTSCGICRRDHKIRNCEKFLEKNVPRRWDIAKRFKLCFRCLGDGHRGKSCQRSRLCGQNGCHKLHHVLLHSIDNRQVEAKSKRCLSNPEARHIDKNILSAGQHTSGTEGNNISQESPTRVAYVRTQKGHTADSRSLPTVPELLTKEDHRRKEENATIKTLTKADITAELKHLCRSEESDRICNRTGDKDQDTSPIAMEGN